MSTTSATTDADTCGADDDATDTDGDVYTWRYDGRYYVGDSSEPMRLSMLVAYAEHGRAALEADEVHHTLPAEAGDERLLIEAPDFLIPLDADEHAQLHADDEWTEVDGIPQLVPDDHGHDGDAGRQVSD